MLTVLRAAGDGPPRVPGTAGEIAARAETGSAIMKTQPRRGLGPASSREQPATSSGAAAASSPEKTSTGAGSDPSSVFFVQRNKNSKEVHYGIRLDSDCRPVGEKPVYNYWVRFSRHETVTEPLTFFQQAGYGLKSQTVSEGAVEVVLKALPDRPILIVSSLDQGRCRVEAYMRIAAAQSRFEKAYVFAEEGLVLPTVKYIDLFGRRADGAPVREHLVMD